ncbi:MULTISPECIES: heparinase II/III domain-containing protein [Chitinophagaceae]
MRILLFLCLLLGFSGYAQESRNYLEKTTSETRLERLMQPTDKWVMLPAYTDRAKWNSIDVSLRTELIAKAVKKLDYQYQFVPASSYLAFATTGDRGIMEKPYSQNYGAVQDLVLGELLEGKGRFLPQIVKGIHNLCAMQTWALSAHLSLQLNGKPGIIDSTQNIIDLGAGRTGAILAWTYYLLGDALDKTEPGTRERLASEINKRIVQPYATRTDFWWMALNGHRLVNNWNVWCNYNSLTCMLLIEKDPKKLATWVYKTMCSVDKFLNYYKDDGACEEGPSYWGEAGGNLYHYLDLLKSVSGGQVDIFGKPLVRNMASYIYKAYIGNDYYVNFADAHAKASPNAALVYSFGKAVGNDTMQSFGAYLNQSKKTETADIYQTLKYLLNYREMQDYKAAQPLLLDVYYPETQIVTARDNAGSVNGFYFAAKGGNNDESHNHNDIGSFILYYNGSPLLIDIGSGTYTAQTFSSRRYELFNTRSINHNIPMVNGYEQKEGAKYKASSFVHNADNQKSKITIGIETAYPVDASVRKWNRTYTLHRGKDFTIEDDYSLTDNKGKTQLNFVTPVLPKQLDSKLSFDLNGKTIYLNYNKNILDCRIVPMDMTDPSFVHQWGNVLYRVEFVFKQPALTGKNMLKVSL